MTNEDRMFAVLHEALHKFSGYSDQTLAEAVFDWVEREILNRMPVMIRGEKKLRLILTNSSVP